MTARSIMAKYSRLVMVMSRRQRRRRRRRRRSMERNPTTHIIMAM